MATLETFTGKIEKEASGETVRDSIIGAANVITKGKTNAGSLNGIPADQFATNANFEKYCEELDTIIKFDAIEDIEDNDAYALVSTGIMTSGNLYQVVKRYIRPSLRKIMRRQNDPEENVVPKQAIVDYINQITEGKEKLFDALKAKGQDPKDATCFKDIITLIENIGQINPVLIDGGTLDKEQKYDADYDDHGHQQAYYKVTVNVPNKLETKSVNENHVTITAPEGKLYSSISVNVSASAQSASSRYGGGRSSGAGSSTDAEGMLSEKSITENDTYLASDDSVDGWSSLSVHVSPPEFSEGTTFTVTFMTSGENPEELGTSTVSAYGTARFNGTIPDPPSANMVFAGWEPVPNRVIEDITVYAKYKRKPEVQSGEIEDDWPTILESKGTSAGCEIGKWKTYDMGTVNGHAYGQLIFQKVAEGEDGSSSTWVSRTVCNCLGSVNNQCNWPLSRIRTNLNGYFLEDLAMTDYGSEFLRNVLPVRKRTMCFWGQDLPSLECSIESETIDMFWIPSFSEMFNQVPSDLYEKWIIHYMNLKKLDGTYESTNHESGGIAVTGTWNWPGGTYNSQTRWESRYTSYVDSGAYKGVNFGVDIEPSGGSIHNLITVTPKDASSYIKYNSNSTETPVNYSLRSITCAYGYPNAGGNPIPSLCSVSNTGAINTTGGDYVPIGFCL